jgi:predicted double-glycine peptidase
MTMKSGLAGIVVAVLACGMAQAGGLDLAGVGGRFTVKVTSLKEARFKATTRQQFDFSCGSAALATLLTHHYARPVSEQAVFEAMYAQGDQAKIRREGFSLLDMKNYLKAQGFEADGFDAPLQQLQASGLPAIVLIVENGYHHFVVLKGLHQARVLLGDPSRGTRAMALVDFERVWVDRLLFVIHNQQHLARFNQAQDWQAAPRAPLSAALYPDTAAGVSFNKLGPGDF